MASEEHPHTAPSSVADKARRDTFQQINARMLARQQMIRLPAAYVVPIIGGLLVLVADAQALALIPLQGTLIEEYGLTPMQAGWTLSATSIATAAAVPTMTRMGDRYGLRKMLLISLGVVTVGQAICSLADSFLPLVIGRSIIGFSAAVALVYALIREGNRDVHGVNRSMGILTSANGVGIALSFLFGGFILKLNGNASTFFWVITAMCCIVWVLTYLFVQDSPMRSKSPVDWAGGLLLGVALVALVLAVARVSSDGLLASSTIALAIVVGLGTLLWVAWERRARSPMIDVRLLARRTVWPAATIAGLANGLGIYNSLVVSGYVQVPEQMGFGMSASALMAGVYLLPISVPIAFGGILAAPVIRKFGQRVCMIAGSIVIVLNQAWMAYNHETAVHIIIGTAVFGAAYAITYTAALGGVMTNARRGEAGMLSGIMSVSSTVAMAIIPAVVVAALATSTVAVPGTQTALPSEDAFTTALLWSAALAAAMLILSWLARTPQFSTAYTDDVVTLSDEMSS